MKKNATRFELYNESDFIDNDDYPSHEKMLKDVEKGLSEYAAFERGEIELRTTCVDRPDEPVSIPPQNNYVSTARLTNTGPRKKRKIKQAAS